MLQAVEPSGKQHERHASRKFQGKSDYGRPRTASSEPDSLPVRRGGRKGGGEIESKMRHRRGRASDDLCSSSSLLAPERSMRVTGRAASYCDSFTGEGLPAYTESVWRKES